MTGRPLPSRIAGTTRLGLLAGLAWCAPADARDVPFSDTEDASLGSVAVGDGRWHPIARLNLRNGDYARGSYDDDSSSLDRLPVHGELGLVWDAHHGADGDADAWVELHSSNGFHAPSRAETASPRAWYESNNLVGVAIAPAKGVRTALTYTIKASPNDVASTSHEASLALSYEGEHGLGWLHPGLAATVRPRGGHGLFTQATVEPEWKLGGGAHPASVSVPLVFGAGWGGFYQAGTGTLVYGSAGLAYARPFTVGATHWSLRGEMAALFRERGLARLDGTDANRATVVPIGQLTLSLAY